MTFQLQQEVKDWSTSHAELSEQMKSFEKTQKDLQVALSQKDDTINVSLYSKYMFHLMNSPEIF